MKQCWVAKSWYVLSNFPERMTIQTNFLKKGFVIVFRICFNGKKAHSKPFEWLGTAGNVRMSFSSLIWSLNVQCLIPYTYTLNFTILPSFLTLFDQFRSVFKGLFRKKNNKNNRYEARRKTTENERPYTQTPYEQNKSKSDNNKNAGIE